VLPSPLATATDKWSDVGRCFPKSLELFKRLLNSTLAKKREKWKKEGHAILWNGTVFESG
jgi:hypothetical protein